MIDGKACYVHIFHPFKKYHDFPEHYFTLYDMEMQAFVSILYTCQNLLQDVRKFAIMYR